MDEPGRTKRAIAALKRLDSGERMIALARAGRRRLPGDHRYGDSLSLTGSEAPARGGRVVKRLGDGVMAVFEEPAAAVQAACEAATAVADVYARGLRAGVHVG